MPRYLIHRKFSITEEEMPRIGRRSKKLVTYDFPKVVWEHSHVFLDDDGTPKSFCIYAAPSETMVREHAVLLGDHTIQNIYEIAGDVSPADFPLVDDPV